MCYVDVLALCERTRVRGERTIREILTAVVPLCVRVAGWGPRRGGGKNAGGERGAVGCEGGLRGVREAGEGREGHNTGEHPAGQGEGGWSRHSVRFQPTCFFSCRRCLLGLCTYEAFLGFW